ncbi:nucleoside hydrolase [candidate division KSB1 bacterium]|nr:nucleoside hydrolase [candidate division KSB1 bacterium]
MKKVIVIISLLFIMVNLGFSNDKQKVIFDCDLGGDIDDAFAVALLLASPEFEILGFVMDHGLTKNRAQVACRLLYETGREDIPVVVGKETPGIVGKDKEPGPYTQQFHWAKGFDRIKPIQQNAVDFIIENIRKYPNEVILFTVGPVPNIADVIEKDPDALKLAKHIYSMFGSFYIGYGSNPVPSAEWNVFADVKSSQKFTESGAKITYAGLDVTTMVNLDEENRSRLWMRESPLTDALSALYTLWRFERYAHPDPTLFDVVPIGMVLWPELFTTRKAFIKVTDSGYTVIDESKEPNCEIGMTVKKEELIRRMMERLLKQNMRRSE